MKTNPWPARALNRRAQRAARDPRRWTGSLGAALLASVLAHSSLGRAGEYQSWVGALGQRDIGQSRVIAWVDVHARRFAAASALLVRPGLGYHFGKNLAGHAGYAWTPVFESSGGRSREQRVWEQLVYSGGLGQTGRFALRPRLEQRFLSSEPGVAHRLRLFARASFELQPRSLILIGWEEFFFGLNDASWGPAAGFDQNRLFVGLGFPSAAGPRFELGYLNIHLNRSRDQTNHALAINTFF